MNQPTAGQPLSGHSLSGKPMSGNPLSGNPLSGHPTLERLLAKVLQYGTWTASAIIGLGLALALLDSHAVAHSGGVFSGMRIVSIGIVLFILLPAIRVLLMLIVFWRERDYRFSAIAALVLIILILGFVVGMRTGAGAG